MTIDFKFFTSLRIFGFYCTIGKKHVKQYMDLSIETLISLKNMEPRII